MWEWYWIVLAVLIAGPFLFVQVVKWVVLPIKVKRSQRMKARGDFSVAMRDQLTPEMIELLDGVSPDFAAEGYEFRAALFQAEGVPGVRSVQAIYVNPATRDVASVVSVSGNSSGAKTRHIGLGVGSHFTDGTTLSTWSSRGGSFSPPNPKVDGVNFWWTTDVRVMCEAHRRRLHRRGRANEPRVAPDPGGEADYAEAEWVDELKRMAGLGYYHLSADGEFYHYTWKGAFLGSWRVTDPVRRRRVRKRERKHRREWAELGMDEFRPAQTAAAHRPPPLPHIESHAPPGGELRYETALREGEICREWAGDSLTVRMGTPTVARFLARQWLSILFAVVGVLVLTFVGWALLTYYTSPVPAAGAGKFPNLWPLAIVFAFTAWDIFNLVLGLVRLRGPMTVTASRAGLTFRNGPGRPMSGEVARQDLEGLYVHAAGAGALWRPKMFLLVAITIDHARYPLMVGKDNEALEQVRDDLMRAMGAATQQQTPITV